MQYANIIVNHKAGYAPLTYSIPPSILAHLKPGSIVRVPLGKSDVHGVVVSFTRRVETRLAHKIKLIKTLVYGGAFVAPYLLAAVSDLHHKYALSYSDLLFSLLPPLPQKKYIVPEATPKLGSGFKSYDYTIDVLQRVDLYKKIAKSLAHSNQSLLIVCPNQAAVESLFQSFNDVRCIRYPDTPTPKQTRDYYFLAQTNQEPAIFIGTRGALLTPLHTFGAIALEEPWLSGHKEEQSPRM